MLNKLYLFARLWTAFYYQGCCLFHLPWKSLHQWKYLRCSRDDQRLSKRYFSGFVFARPKPTKENVQVVDCQYSQKVNYRVVDSQCCGLLRTVARKFSIGGICVSAGKLCFCAGTWSVVWGAKPTKAPVATDWDCYVARTTELCNSLGGSISFGCIESCIVGRLLREKKYKNVCEVFSGALTTQKQTMRDNVFMQLLWKSHFLVMWYGKLTNQLTIYNSVEGFEPDLLSAVQNNLVKPLSTFCTSEPLLKSDRFVFQSDTSSCGACVYYTIDAIAVGMLERHIKPFRVNDYRMWVVHVRVLRGLKFLVRSRMSLRNLASSAPHSSNAHPPRRPSQPAPAPHFFSLKSAPVRKLLKSHN